MENTLSPYEEKARSIKAGKIADLLALKGATAAQVAAMDNAGWEAAAELVGVRLPSQTTRDEVVERIAFRAKLKAKMANSNPFAGFPKAGEL